MRQDCRTLLFYVELTRSVRTVVEPPPAAEPEKEALLRAPSPEKPKPRMRDKARPKLPGLVFKALLGHELAPSVIQALNVKAGKA